MKNKDSETGKFLPRNKAAVKHGGYSFFITGKVPSVRGARALRKSLGEIRQELEKATPEMNVKKELLIEQIVNAHGFLKLIEMHIKKRGILRPDKFRRGVLELHPALANSYLSFLNSQRAAILALGLNEGQAEKILTPYEIVEEEESGHNSGDK